MKKQKQYTYTALWAMRDILKTFNEKYQQAPTDENLVLLEKASDLVTSAGCYICCKVDDSGEVVVDKVVDCIEDYKWYIKKQAEK